jgi:hypothetical protein
MDQKLSPFHMITKETEDEIREYISTLNEKELKAYKIAFDHLGSSFQLEKSNGFKTWKKSKMDMEK